jgi:signal transduction histidine kinase
MNKHNMLHSLEFGLALQLGLAFLLAGGGAVLLSDWLRSYEAINAFSRWVMALQTAVFLGLLLTINLLQTLPQLRKVLRQIEQGAANLEPLTPRWPLTALIRPLNALVRREQESGKLRGQLRHQVQEAAAQEERNRLARDLHDSIKQQLYSVSLSAATAQARWQADPDGAKLALTDVQQSAQAAMVEMNALLQQLRPFPLENKGLIAALREQVEALAHRTGAEVTTYFCQLPPDEWLPPGAQTDLFRIAQEALSNIARHARANQVTLSIEQLEDHQDAFLQLTISDDGQGFDPQNPPTGMGLTNMAQRADDAGANWQIESKPGEGTRLRFTLPLRKPDPAPAVEDPYLAKAKWTLKYGLILLGLTSLVALPIAYFSPPGFAFLLIVSLFVSLPMLTAAAGQRLREAFHPDESGHLALRQRLHLINTAAYLCLVSISIVPYFSFARAEQTIPLMVTMGPIATLLALWEVGRYYNSRAKRWALLGIRERERVRTQAREQHRIRWWITAVLVLNVLANTLVNRPAWPVTTMIDWLQSTLIWVALAALLFQLVDTWFIRHHPVGQSAAAAKNSQELT